jgi:hypothetical protein
MKRSIFTLLCYLFISITGFAQVKKVITDVEGNFEVVVKVGNDAFVTISSEGEILDTEINGSFYYSGGKISSIGGIRFYYFGGKVSSIGGVSFYYSGGKISSIGGNSFYYSSGKLSSGNTSFTSNGILFRVKNGN